jgi:hypothetical protein
MTMRADMRFWTAIVMIGFCGFAIARGWSILQFSRAMANVDPSEKRAEMMGGWTGVPGVASMALKTGLEERVDPPDWNASNKRRDELSALLAMKPLSSIDWLSLSRMQLTTAQPRAQMLGSLMMSWVTGPNEGYVMAERGIFGLALWEVLSPDLRSRVTVDLAKGEITENEKFRAVFATKPEEVQSEVRTALVAAGLSPKEVERRLGF